MGLRPLFVSITPAVLSIALSSMPVAHAQAGCAGRGACPDASSRSQDADHAEQRHLRQQLASAHAMARDERYQGADLAFSAALANRAFAELPPKEAHAALSVAAKVATMRDDAARAVGLYERAIAIDDSDPDDHYRLFLLAYDLKQYDIAAQRYMGLARRWPELLGNVGMQPLYGTLRGLDRRSDTRLALLQALYDARWDDPVEDASFIWSELAMLRLERDEIAAARAAIKRITSPAQIVRLRMDKRFDPIVDRDAWLFDVDAAAGRAVEAMREKHERAPKRLDVMNHYSHALLVSGRHEDVVALVDAVTGAIAAAPVSESPYERMDSLVWLMNDRAVALRRMGRTQEALDEMLRARVMTESGHPNVSQALNLGSLLCRMGKPDEADEAIAEVATLDKEISGYGRMVEASIRTCIARAQGDRRGVERALTYLRRHREDGPVVELDALVEAGREGEAARALIRMLASPDDREQALLWAQTFRRFEPMSNDAGWLARRDTVLARDDVRAAIDRVGRVEVYSIDIGYDF